MIFFVTWVNQNMKGLFRALSLKNYLQRIFAPRRNWADHQHDSSFVPAKVSRELHLQRETDVIQGELGGQGDRVIRVLKVNESRLLGRKRNLLTGGCCARVEGWRRPCSIPAAMENFKVTIKNFLCFSERGLTCNVISILRRGTRLRPWNCRKGRMCTTPRLRISLDIHDKDICKTSVP